MSLDPPDPRRPSLVRQLLVRARSGTRAPAERARQGATIEESRWPAFALAGLLTLAPLLTIGGAAVAERRTRAQIDGLAHEVEPKLLAGGQANTARARLRTLLATPTLGTTLDGLARALPSDAALASAERAADGRLRVEVAAPDPDRLRAALRRDPATSRLRDTGQQRGEGAMVVTLEERAP